MLKPPFLLFLLLAAGVLFKANAQNAPDCRSAIPVCADQPIVGIADGGGDIDDFDPEFIRTTGCLEKGSVASANIENNTVWYVFRAGTDGQVGFDIQALPVSPGATITSEWDFAVYGPDVDCQSISNGSSQPIRCNYEVNNTNFTGLGVNPADGRVGAPNVVGSQNTYDEYLNVNAGEIYYILINNFNTNLNGDPERFELTFTGNSVSTDQNTALDCTLRDRFLGLDIIACESDGDIPLSALNSPAGSDIDSVEWSVDYDDNGSIDEILTGTGPFGAEYTVISPNSGRYFATITTVSGTPPTVTHPNGILITFYADPIVEQIIVLEDLTINQNPDRYQVEILVAGDSDYEYSLNGGSFQDQAVFTDIPPGLNTLVVNDKNGCGITEPIQFLVVGYPKFFSPNGDSQQDFWQVFGLETLDNAQILIFDRFGKLLVQLDQNNPTWDGTFNGTPLPSSDYWFRLDYDFQNAPLIATQLRRHFSLVR